MCDVQMIVVSGPDELKEPLEMIADSRSDFVDLLPGNFLAFVTICGRKGVYCSFLGSMQARFVPAPPFLNLRGDAVMDGLSDYGSE
jgi:hypothetical protein